MLTMRLLFHLNGKTCVQGQPPSCIIYHIPNVLFSDPFRTQLFANSAVSPDSFLVATLSRRGSLGWQPPLELPPAPLWRGHPCVQWAALRVAYLLPSLSAERPRTESDKTLEDARELVHVAQEQHPQNGALWLADALILFRLDQVDAALSALESATEKQEWSAQSRQLRPYATRLLVAQGLSRLDAVIEANGVRDSLAVMSRVSRCLQKEMVNAVESENEARFSRLVAVRQKLQLPVWDDAQAINRFRLFPLDTELINAMALKLGRSPLPDWRGGSYGKRDEIASAVLCDYLENRVGGEQAAQLISEGETAKEQIRREQSDSWEQTEKPIMVRWFHATIGGTVVLYSLAALIVSLSIRLPFRALPDNFNRIFPRSLRFWALAFLALTLSTVVLASAFNSVCQPVGFGPAGPKPLLTQFWENNLGALVICSGWFAAKMLFHARLKFPSWLPSTTVLLVWLYVVAATFTAYMRVELINRLLAN